MNIIILILAAAAAYLLTLLLTIIDGTIAKWQLKQEEKKRYSNELYCYKVKKVLLTAYECGLQSGLTCEQAHKMAIRYIKDVENANLLDYKYDLIRGGNDRIGIKTSCR